MKPIVAIMMGSDSDANTLKPCGEVLREFGIPFTARVLSAHRTPREALEFVEQSQKEGVRVFICAAGGAAHLAGVVAAHTHLPVIGIPVETSFMGGLDSLLSTVQMPAGTPVATVGAHSGGVRNAAFLAARILGLTDPAIAERVLKIQDENRKKVLSKKVEL